MFNVMFSVSVQRPFPCKLLPTHSTQILLLLVIMWTTGDTVTAGFSHYSTGSFTCTTCKTLDVDVKDVLAQAVCLYANFSGK